MATLTPALLFWGLAFGSLGAGYAVYGKRQSAPVPLLCGIALMAFPYFVSNTILLVVIGGMLAAAPFLFRR